MNQAGRPRTLMPYTWATPLCRPRLATEPTCLCRYVAGPRAADHGPRCCRPAGLACRTACWALGEHSAPGSVEVRSGTAAQSPALQAPSTIGPVGVDDLQRRQAGEPALAVARQVGVLQHRRRLHAGRPHDRVGLEAVAVGELARHRPHRTPAGSPAGCPCPGWRSCSHRVGAHVPVDLGQHPLGRLDQHPVHVGRVELGVVAQRVAGHVLHLGQRLDAGVAAADEDERQRPPAGGRVHCGRRHVEPLQHVVAQPDRLADGLEADRVLAQAGDRQGPRHRAGRDHDDGRTATSTGGPTIGCTVATLRACSMRVTSPERTRQRRSSRRSGTTRVARRDVAGRRLGQERLVRHVRLRVDDRDLGLGRAQLLRQAQRRVEADVIRRRPRESAAASRPSTLLPASQRPDVHGVAVAQLTAVLTKARTNAGRTALRTAAQLPREQAGQQPAATTDPTIGPTTDGVRRSAGRPAPSRRRPTPTPTTSTVATRPAQRRSTRPGTTASYGRTAASAAAAWVR